MSQRIAIYDVNDYILNQIPTLFGYTSTQQYKPILPIQDVPEAITFPGAYMTYSVRTSIDPNQWWISTDDVNFMIWDKALADIQDVQVALTNLFRRMDDSATDIMTYLSGIPRNDFTFLSFKMIGTMSPAPLTLEAERYGQPFNFRYTYMLNSGTGISY